MIWDQDIHTVVILSNIDDQEMDVFWPENDLLRIGQLKIKHTEEGLLSGFQTKDFRLECGESTPRVIRIIFSSGWSVSENKSASENGDSINLVSVIHSRQDNLPPRPLIVMDTAGATQAATYCALSNLFRQVNYDASVDIYLT